MWVKAGGGQFQKSMGLFLSFIHRRNKDDWNIYVVLKVVRLMSRENILFILYPTIMKAVNSTQLYGSQVPLYYYSIQSCS
jgi:hypothetical protein